LKKERRPVAPPLPPPPRARSLDEEPAPHAPAGQIEFAPLYVPTVPDFDTISSKIAAIPTEHAETASAVLSGSSFGARIRRDLRSPEQLRSAFVLREILGPPRGLQSD
jgi:hypothetical protein